MNTLAAPQSPQCLPRVLVHLDVDAFFASVEQVLQPELRGRPVIVGSGVVASCSYESRAFGVRTAMLIRDARQLCPQGIFLAGDYGHYALFANRIEGICRDFTPVVEQSSLDDFYLDLTGCPGCPSSASGLGRAIQTQIGCETGLSCSVGIGRNKLFAKLASDAGKPGGVIELRPHEEAAWLSRLNVSELPGAGPRVCEQLARYSVRSVAQLAALPQSILVRLFGANGRTLWERARGIDERPVREVLKPQGKRRTGAGADSEPAGVPGSISRETTFETPTADDTFLRGMLSYLVQRAAWDLRHRQLEARALGVKLRYGDFETVRTSRRLATASSEDRPFIDGAYELFAGLYQRRLPVRHLGIELTQFTTADQGQMWLFGEAERSSRRQLRHAVDRVRDRFGFQSLVEGSATHLLDRLDQDRRGFRLRTPSLSR